ncbi:amino acid adenylation domain-containing protein [Actinomadura sp. 3N508]|uniref:amino acid adenylation domain-containing protein n=1 Tax=Actinomadura sp. 3N508 TaxID=3375153 RepID=UPI0037A64CCF
MDGSTTTTQPALLLDLARAGIKIRLAEDGRLAVSAPKGRLSADLRDRIGRHKGELIAWLATATPDPGQDELPRVEPDEAALHEPFPPSDLQISFLVGSGEGVEYHVRPHQYMELEFPDLDPDRFAAALNRSLHRQRRNIAVVRDDMTLETVRDLTPLRVPVTDLRDRDPDGVNQGIEAVRAEMLATELPLDRWPWLDVRITRHPDGARLHYHNNNFFNDGPATGNLLGGAFQYYEHPDQELPEPRISYRDAVLALADLEESPLGRASKEYWCGRMAGWPSAPELPLMSGADARERSRLGRREFMFPAARWAEFKRRAASRGLTATNALYGAYAEVIAYWSGSRHFLLNNMITHRLPFHPDIGAIAGNFASLYPLEVDWRGDRPFHERVRLLQARVMADVQHVHWSGVKVLQTLNQVRGTPGRANCPFVIASGLFLGQAEKPVFGVLETPQVLLDCGLWEVRDGSLWVVWDLFAEMFPDGLIEDMLTGFQEILSRLADEDAAWDRTAFDLLPARQRAQRERLNRPAEPPPPRLLHDALPAQAAERPGHAAVLCGDTALSYAALHERAERLAELLARAGVRGGDLVAVALPKGWRQVPAVFGTLMAGAAYVPIDPSWPADRIRLLLEDTAAAAVLTDEETREALPSSGVPLVCVDGEDAARPADHVPNVRRRQEDLAYVIYTSGSTGRPKGAALDHRGPVNTITDINRRFAVTADDVLFGVSSLCFDLSVYDVFGAADAGATLVLPDQDGPASRGGTTPHTPRNNPEAWLDAVRAHGVTVWNSVPAIMQLLVEAAESAGLTLPSLRTVLLSGDWIPVGLPRRIRAVAPNARVISLGGATEASIWSICYPIDHDDAAWTSVPYGTPLTGQTWHVLDAAGRDAPTWCAGELYIGGTGLALGYHGDPERTAAAFVTHPRTGERLYRTGDLGRYLPSGDIEFLGRADFQVKIQGFRVEPGEIEHALTAHPAVGRAAVVARTAGSGKQLAAFAVADETVTGEELTAFLQERLPSYLVPSHIAVVERLPLTANGKLDRRALEAVSPAADEQRAAGPAAPDTPLAAALVAIWEEVLGTGPIGVHDDFFALGGQSFAALRVVGLIAQRLGHTTSLGTLLERRTVARLAELLADDDASWSPRVQLRRPTGDSDERPPWFLVHPAGGNVLCYQRLSTLLDRSSHAFQAPGPAAGRKPIADAEEFARLYVESLREVQPHGPYLLGGWSSGAVLAFAMARRLEAAGERVDRLVLVDAPAPVAPRRIEETQALLWFLEDLDIGFDPRRAGPDELRALAGTPEPDRLRRALDLAAAQGARTGATLADQAALAGTYAVFRGVIGACNDYRPDTIRAAVTVIRARDGQVGEFAEHPAAGRPDWGWAASTTGPVRTAVVPGTHHTLLTEGRVEAVAELFNRPRLEDA